MTSDDVSLFTFGNGLSDPSDDADSVAPGKSDGDDIGESDRID